jgi:hypothetical protein
MRFLLTVQDCYNGWKACNLFGKPSRVVGRDKPGHDVFPAREWRRKRLKRLNSRLAIAD